MDTLQDTSSGRFSSQEGPGVREVGVLREGRQSGAELTESDGGSARTGSC